MVPLKQMQQYLVETLEQANEVEEEKRNEFGKYVQSVQKSINTRKTPDGDFEYYIVTIHLVFRKPADVIKDIIGE